MKRLIIPALSVLILAGVPVLAASAEENQQPERGGQHQGGQPQHPPAGQHPQQQRPQQQRPQQQHPQQQRPQQHQGAARTQPYPGPRDYTPGQRPANINRPRQFDRRDYHRNYQAQQHYHAGPYNRPSGWYYRRWSYGQILPRIFWAQNYWLTDFWQFGLAVPPYGCEWVRYGDDALLVDQGSGEILQVVYGVFY